MVKTQLMFQGLPIDKRSSFLHVDNWNEFKGKLVDEFGSIEIFRHKALKLFTQLDQPLQNRNELTNVLAPRINGLKSTIKCVADFYDHTILYSITLSSALVDTIIQCIPVSVRPTFLPVLDFDDDISFTNIAIKQVCLDNPTGHENHSKTPISNTPHKPCSLCFYKGFKAQHYPLNNRCGVEKLSSLDILKIIDTTRYCPTCALAHSINYHCVSICRDGTSKACSKGCIHNGHPLKYSHDGDAGNITSSPWHPIWFWMSIQFNLQIRTPTPARQHLLPGEFCQDQPTGLHWSRSIIQHHWGQAKPIQSWVKTCGSWHKFGQWIHTLLPVHTLPSGGCARVKMLCHTQAGFPFCLVATISKTSQQKLNMTNSELDYSKVNSQTSLSSLVQSTATPSPGPNPCTKSTQCAPNPSQCPNYRVSWYQISLWRNIQILLIKIVKNFHRTTKRRRSSRSLETQPWTRTMQTMKRGLQETKIPPSMCRGFQCRKEFDLHLLLLLKSHRKPTAECLSSNWPQTPGSPRIPSWQGSGTLPEK